MPSIVTSAEIERPAAEVFAYAGVPECSDTDGIVAEEARRLV
jgi:hypothetical protein